MYTPSSAEARARQTTQSHVRAAIGLALLFMTMGTQLIWTLVSY